LPEDLNEQLQVAGLTHIVVASGYNLTILIRLSRRLLARSSKYQAFVGSVALMLIFLVITGASPSMVRASVVTTLSLLAWYYGRQFQPWVIILLGAALTAGVNPLFIWHDLGWWLSFLAFSGVLVIAPLVSARFWGKKQPPAVAQVAVETIAAQLMTTPLILFAFGRISLVALAANVAVVPLIPYAMAATAVGGVAGLVLPHVVAAWLALPAQLLLSYMVAATRLFAGPTWAQQMIGLDKAGLTMLYMLLICAAVVFYKKSKLNFAKLPSVVE
jgi:competence protein ComEC